MAEMKDKDVSPLLLPGVYLPVFVQCDERTLGVAAQVCSVWRRGANEEWVWRTLALACWPAPTVNAAAYDGSHKALVLDRNARNASRALPLDPTLSATWKFNHLFGSYRCRILGCSLSPNFPAATSTLRVMFDARGERDLRSPATSHLTLELLITRKQQPAATPAAPATPPTPSNSGPQAPAPVDANMQPPGGVLAGAPAAPHGQAGSPTTLLLVGGGGAAGGVAAPGAGMVVALVPPADPAPVEETSTLVACASAAPTREFLVAEGQGHYKGLLEWDNHATRCLLGDAVAGCSPSSSSHQRLVSLARTKLTELIAQHAGQARYWQARRELWQAARALLSPESQGTCNCCCGSADCRAAAGEQQQQQEEGQTSAQYDGVQVGLAWRVSFFYASRPHRQLSDYHDVTLLEVPWCPGCRSSRSSGVGGGGQQGAGAAGSATKLGGSCAGGNVLAEAWRQQAQVLAAGQWEQELMSQTPEQEAADRALWQTSLLPPEFVSMRIFQQGGEQPAVPDSWWQPGKQPLQPPRWRKVGRSADTWAIAQEWVEAAVMHVPAVNHNHAEEDLDDAPEQQADWWHAVHAGPSSDDDDGV